MSDNNLKRSYDNSTNLIHQLTDTTIMKAILRKLGSLGYDRYGSMIKRKKWSTPPPEKWFRMARHPETPLPDTSRIYHQNGDGNTIVDVGLGLIKDN